MLNYNPYKKHNINDKNASLPPVEKVDVVIDEDGNKYSGEIYFDGTVYRRKDNDKKVYRPDTSKIVFEYIKINKIEDYNNLNSL